MRRQAEAIETPGEISFTDFHRYVDQINSPSPSCSEILASKKIRGLNSFIYPWSQLITKGTHDAPQTFIPLSHSEEEEVRKVKEV